MPWKTRGYSLSECSTGAEKEREETLLPLRLLLRKCGRLECEMVAMVGNVMCGRSRKVVDLDVYH